MATSDLTINNILEELFPTNNKQQNERSLLTDAITPTNVIESTISELEEATTDTLPRQYQDPDFVCGTIGDVLSEMTWRLSTDAQVINQITNYLSTGASAAINDAIRASGIQQLQTDMKLIEYEVSSLKGLFTTKIGTSDSPLGSSLNIIDRAESIVNTLDRLDTYVNDIIGHIENITDTVENIPNTIESAFNNFQSTLEKLTDFDLSSTLDKLPNLVADKLLDIDVVKEPLILLNNVQTTVSSVTAMTSSIRAPQNLNDVRTLLSTLRGIIGQINLLKSQADRVVDSTKNLASVLRSGNYVSLVASLAAGGVIFFERPPTYNAIYPYNRGYSTHGGHVFEHDNTPGSERLNYTHPSKTSVEIQPDGAVVVKGKSDFQVSVTKNCDVLIKNAATIAVQGDVRISANNINAEAKGNIAVSSSGTALVNSASTASVVAKGSVVVSSGGTATVSSVGGTSISSNGPLTLSSNTSVDIISDGPVTINGNSQTDNISGAVIRNNASCTESSSGIHKINAGLITLN